jgi:hypothetical protein
MTFDFFKSLLRTTLTDPRAAGQQVIAMNLPMNALWLALMLTSVVLSLLVSALFLATPIPDDEMGELIRMSPAHDAPIMFALLNWGQAVITVFIFHWIGRALGGQGELRDMLSVMIWLQVVSLVLAVSLFVLGLIFPLLAVLAMTMAFFWGIWVLVALVDAANRYDNMAKAFGVCLLALVAFSISMTIFSAIIGGTTRVGA